MKEENHRPGSSKSWRSEESRSVHINVTLAINYLTSNN